MSDPSITVVVPTRGRPEALRRCLAALGRQRAQCEVIVVDDAPVPDGRVAGVALDAGARLLASGGVGPAAARNAGAMAASGAILCFTDDDCEPRPDWAGRLAAACAATGAAAGETVNAKPHDRFAAASQLVTSQLQRSSLRVDGTLGFAPSSNLAMTAAVAQALPFDGSFPGAAGEDRDWCARAARQGAAPRYVPEAVVEHRQALGWRGFLRQQWRYGHGAAALRRTGTPLAGRRARAELLGAALRAGPAVAPLVALSQLVVACGFARELMAAAARGRHPAP